MFKNHLLFEAKDIEKDFPLPHGQELHVLEKINLSIHPNEVVAIIGPSGCGKSTLLRILAGLIPPTKGERYHHGHKIEGLLPNMSMVFQSFALYPWMTVKQNIDVVLKAAGASVDEMMQKTKEAIALIGLTGFEEAYPREISGGMKQRVGIARALVRNPEMLFMDEPFSELDAFTAEVLRSEVIKIWSNKKLPLSSILIVSHDVREVAFMADRIIVLGMHPTSVLAVIENPLPRPRDYHSPEFLSLVEQLHDTYGKIEPPTIKRAPKKERITPLLPATIDEIVGLLKFLWARKGSQDIFKIGAESNIHFDKLTIILQAAELFDFVGIVHRTVTLMPRGKEFLEGNEKQRHLIWKQQLLTIPLFIKMVDLLKKAPNHSLDRQELLSILSRALPHQDANIQLHTLIRWGHYGELFTYRRRTKSVTYMVSN